MFLFFLQNDIDKYRYHVIMRACEEITTLHGSEKMWQVYYNMGGTERTVWRKSHKYASKVVAKQFADSVRKMGYDAHVIQVNLTIHNARA